MHFRLVVRTRSSSSSSTVPARIADLNAVFAPAEHSFAAAGPQVLASLQSVDIGTCGDGLTPAQKSLFAGVSLAADQIAVFLAGKLSGIAADLGATGCAGHPPGRRGVVVAESSGRWVLAHEIGHVLGFEHTDEGLMVERPSQLPANEVPALPVGVGSFAAPAHLEIAEAPSPSRSRPGRRHPPSERGVQALVRKALAGVARRADVIGRVGAAIEDQPRLRAQYRRLLRSGSASSVHRAIGQEVRKQTGMISTPVKRKGSGLFGSYTLLTRKTQLKAASAKSRLRIP